MICKLKLFRRLLLLSTPARRQTCYLLTSCVQVQCENCSLNNSVLLQHRWLWVCSRGGERSWTARRVCVCAGLGWATLLAPEQRYIIYLHSWLAREVASEQSDFIVTQVAVVMAERRRMKVHSRVSVCVHEITVEDSTSLWGEVDGTWTVPKTIYKNVVPGRGSIIVE